MRSLVVLSVLFAVSAAKPSYSVFLKSSPALVTAPVYAEVQPAISIVSPAVYSVPAAVSHQSRVDAKIVPVVSQGYVVDPVVKSAVVSAPVSVVPSATYIGGSAVSHQSRVDVKSYPAVVSQQVVPSAVVSPVVQAVPVARTVYLAPAVSHQSRVDVKSSPAFFSEHIVSPVVAHSVPAVYSAW